MAGAKLADENARLREENTNLRARQDAHKDMVPDHNVYWLEPDRDGPYCPKCLDGDDRRVRMGKQIGVGSPYWECPVCLRREDTPEAVEQTKRALARAEQKRPPEPYF